MGEFGMWLYSLQPTQWTTQSSTVLHTHLRFPLRYSDSMVLSKEFSQVSLNLFVLTPTITSSLFTGQNSYLKISFLNSEILNH